ncbi:unnamed protein product [Rhodiola kirilowii]
MLLSHSTIPLAPPPPPPPHPHPHRPLLHLISVSSFPSISSSFNPNPQPSSNASIKMPNAPWMKGPILLQPDDVLDTNKPSPRGRNQKDFDCVFTGKIGGRRGERDVKRISQSLEKLQERTDSDIKEEEGGDKAVEEFEFGGILEKLKRTVDVKNAGKMPWDKTEEEMVLRRSKKERVVTKAEMSLDAFLLERLRHEARRMRKWVKVKKAGVTREVVAEIRLIWRNQELVMVKFDVPLCRNMPRACEIIEMKTGGLVVWTKKDSLVVYRGSDSKLYSRTSKEMHRDLSNAALAFSLKFNNMKVKSQDGISLEIEEHPSLPIQPNENSQIFKEIKLNDVVVHGSLYEREADRLLEGLGPRYADWWMLKPLPVDGDLLPEVIPGYMPPPRRSPPYGKSSISDHELTYLRKLAPPLPTHFVLGRNRKLQGLASAIVKLWEKTHIVKIAIKWGVQNTDNEQMARELKSYQQGLTGGVLLLRNKYLIILYRGKDFLPSGVANLIMNRDTVLMECQLHEEDARLRAAHALNFWDSGSSMTSAIGTLSEHQTIGNLNLPSVIEEDKLRLEAEKQKLDKELRIQEHKLFLLNRKIKKSAAELSELNSNWTPSITCSDAELITEEERECLLKIALKMSRSLVLGRRGIFDGVIEGIHQNWKYREVVKVITMQRQYSQVINTATMLEAESRGVLVSIKKLKEGHAIILYRGKNYKRPSVVETKNLLTKREAFLRSIEMQRFGSLKYFANQRQRRITDLRSKLEDIERELRVY